MILAVCLLSEIDKSKFNNISCEDGEKLSLGVVTRFIMEEFMYVQVLKRKKLHHIIFMKSIKRPTDADQPA